jgi:hypothetical protein
LQTADYARAVFRGLAELQGQRDIEVAVRERLRRQELLYEPGRRFQFLLTEAALRARLAPASAHRAQLDRLLVLAGLETVELAVLASETPLIKATTHSFEIFDDRMVLVETITAELAIREAEDVAFYTKLFELYWGIAKHRAEASALITRIALELPG